MSWLSLYGLTQTQPGKAQIKIWRVWTNEEKAYVVKMAYEKYYLTSDDIQEYLKASRLNTISNIAFPLATFYLYHNFVQRFFLKRLTAKTGGGLLSYSDSTLFTAAASLLWINIGPVYQYKSDLRVNILEKVYKKLGNSMIRLNDILPRSWTESQIDRQARVIYHERNSMFTNSLYPGQDNMRPLLEESKARKYSRRPKK